MPLHLKVAVFWSLWCKHLCYRGAAALRSSAKEAEFRGQLRTAPSAPKKAGEVGERVTAKTNGRYLLCRGGGASLSLPPLTILYIALCGRAQKNVPLPPAPVVSTPDKHCLSDTRFSRRREGKNDVSSF